MRSWEWFACVLLVAAACGEAADEPTTTVEPANVTTTTTSSATTSTTQPAATTNQAATTTIRTPVKWTVEALGRNPEEVLGPGGAMGSGCSPGTDHLPDGVWFGWIEDIAASSLDFDLACLWSGRVEPAASNDAARVRTVPVAEDTLVYLDEDPTPHSGWSGETTSANNAPGLPRSLPYWLFVNDGVVTEMAEYPEPVVWALSQSAWGDLSPGCCDMGDVAPPSPEAPLPESGWPPDGFYKVWLMTDEDVGWNWPDSESGTSYELNVARWLSCRDNPGLCPEWWEGDEVIMDPAGATLQTTLEFDEDLTVVIMPILGDTALVGDGPAFAELIADMNTALDRGLDSVDSDGPGSPFGRIPLPEETEGGELGFRGPGGTYLTWFGGWMALEMRDGLPILYIHAGLVAG